MLSSWKYAQFIFLKRNSLNFNDVLDDVPLLIPGAVAGLGGLLGRAPPGLVGHVPVDGLAQALHEVGVLRLPAELSSQFRAVDGVAAVAAGAVGHPVEVVRVLPHSLEDHAQHGDVVLLPVGADATLQGTEMLTDASNDNYANCQKKQNGDI